MDRKTLLILTGCVAPALLVVFVAVAIVGAGAFGAIAFSEDFYPRGDLTDTTREEAALAGYTVPEGAAAVHIKDRALQDVRVTWFRFDLDETRRAQLQDKHNKANDKVAGSWSGKVPAHWPQWTSFDDFHQPPWWAPAPGAASYARESRDGGALIVFDGDKVYQLLWTFEGWAPPQKS